MSTIVVIAVVVLVLLFVYWSYKRKNAFNDINQVIHESINYINLYCPKEDQLVLSKEISRKATGLLSKYFTSSLDDIMGYAKEISNLISDIVWQKYGTVYDRDVCTNISSCLTYMDFAVVVNHPQTPLKVKAILNIAIKERQLDIPIKLYIARIASAMV